MLIKFYVYRTMVAQGNFLTVCDEVSDKSDAELRAVKLLADYLADVDNQVGVVAKVKARLGALCRSAQDHRPSS